MLAVAHRTPRTVAACRELVDLGVGIFEVDVQVVRGGVVVSHFLPLAAALHPDRRGDARPVTVRHTFLDRRTVHRLRQVTPEVIAWTVNDLRRAGQLAELGVTGRTSDNPRVHAYAASR